jgi:hypothetical protein
MSITNGVLNVILCPALYLEMKGFNPKHQSENIILKELVSRVVALVVPILYIYQFALHTTITLVDLGLAIFQFSPGIILQSSLGVVIVSANFGASSILEIPQKLICGHHYTANYLGKNYRYGCFDFMGDLGQNLM